MKKYDKDDENENIEDEKIIYITLEDEEPEGKIKDIEDIPEEIIKNKELKYLKKTDEPKEDINENIYIIKDEEEPEEIIYIETIEEIKKDKKYKKKIYVKKEDIPENEENNKITYLTKYDKDRDKDKDSKILYLILTPDEDKQVEEKDKSEKEIISLEENKTYILIEKPKEIKHLKINNDYCNKNISHNIKDINKLPILFYPYILPEILGEGKTIDTKKEKKEDIIDDKEKEKIINKEIDEKEKIIDVPSKTEEIISEQIIPSDTILKNIEEPFIIKDQEDLDLEDKNRRPKTQINKIDIKEKINSLDNLELFVPDYIYMSNDNENFIPNIIKESPELNIVKSQYKEVIDKKEEQSQKDILVENIPETKEKEDEEDINRKKSEEKIDEEEKKKKKEKEYKIENINNRIENENIFNNDLKLNKLENSQIKNYILEEGLQLPSSLINEKIKQKPAKLKKINSEIIDIPSITDEISLDKIVPNNPIIKEINTPFIIKDEILEEDLFSKEIQPKISINKIKFIQNINASKNLELNNPNYIYQINNNDDIIPKCNLKYNELNLINPEEIFDKLKEK